MMPLRLAYLALAGALVAAPIARGEDAKDVPAPAPAPTTRTDPAGQLLNKWFAEGSGAGHHGDFYDNRDEGHSRLDLSKYPQLKPLPYTEARLEAKRHYGPAQEIRSETVFGNASLAGPAVGGASIPRLVYGTREGIAFLTKQYLGNQLYVYPEHQDHDHWVHPGNGWGDLYAVNSPYLIVSQGSSGSDQPFLDAVAMTLASFRPEVKEQLRREKLLMPVVQQILRSSLTTVEKREDYLTAGAHPSAFPAEWLDVEKMMRAAHDLTPTSLPPLFHLEVVSESDPPRPGIDFFEGPGRESESLADRGMAIARIFRGMGREREITVRASGFRNPSGRPLKLHWRILRGDPDLVTIERSETAPEATIRVAWHEKAFEVPAGPPRLSSRRVEIGVFADDGERYSPPSFVTFYFLPNETRVYDEAGKILECDYGIAASFTDITLTSTKAWRDVYQYDKTTGDLRGWRRETGGGEPVEFDAAGRRLGHAGPEPVRYEIDPNTHRLVQTVGEAKGVDKETE